MRVLTLIAIACLGLALMALVWRLLLRRRFQTACCARCRYEIRGLPSSICPECGVDLDATGVFRAGQRQPLHPLAKLAIWSGLIGSLAVLVTPSLDRRLPPTRTFSISVMFGSPQSAAYRRLTVRGQNTSRATEIMQIHELEVSLTRHDGTTATLLLNLERQAGRYLDRQGEARRSSFQTNDQARTLLMEWMTSAIEDGDEQLLAAEAAELARVLTRHEHFVQPDAAGIISWSDVIRSTDSRSPLGRASVTRSIVPAIDRERWGILVGPWLVLWLLALPLVLRRARTFPRSRLVEAGT